MRLAALACLALLLTGCLRADQAVGPVGRVTVSVENDTGGWSWEIG